jgi:LPXTG-motif cell wall-anchored protein
MSVTAPPVGVQVHVVDGKLVVTRTSNYIGTTTFTYEAMAKNGTEVHVAVTAHVLGETITAPSLPFTGADIGLFAIVGMSLLATGIFAVFVGRRRRTEPNAS